MVSLYAYGNSITDNRFSVKSFSRKSSSEGRLLICLTAASMATINLHLILGIEVEVEVWEDVKTLLKSIDVFICRKFWILLFRYLSLSYWQSSKLGKTLLLKRSTNSSLTSTEFVKVGGELLSVSVKFDSYALCWKNKKENVKNKKKQNKYSYINRKFIWKERGYRAMRKTEEWK